MRKLYWICLVAGGLCWNSLAEQPPDYVIDQAHDLPFASEGVHSLIGFPSITQEFVPQFTALNVVEILTRDWSFPLTNGIGGTLQVTIRDDSTNGPVLGVSEPLQLPDGWIGPSQFAFSTLVPLTPGRRHAIEVRLLEGNNWGVESYGAFAPPYEAGRYFVGTNLVNGADMWFRTGIRPPAVRLEIDPAQINVIRWQGIPPLTYSVWTSTNLTTWTQAGLVQSTTPSYSFTNNAPAPSQLFYRVSAP